MDGISDEYFIINNNNRKIYIYSININSIKSERIRKLKHLEIDFTNANDKKLLNELPKLGEYFDNCYHDYIKFININPIFINTLKNYLTNIKKLEFVLSVKNVYSALNHIFDIKHLVCLSLYNYYTLNSDFLDFIYENIQNIKVKQLNIISDVKFSRYYFYNLKNERKSKYSINDIIEKTNCEVIIFNKKIYKINYLKLHIKDYDINISYL